MVEHENFVAVDNRAQAMRDDEHGRPDEVVPEHMLDLLICRVVWTWEDVSGVRGDRWPRRRLTQIGRRLVQEQDGRVLELE